MDTKIKPQTLKGFRDFLGVDSITRSLLIEKIKNIFELFGYEPLETPALEYAETLLGKYGNEADKLLYIFEDRGKRKVGLRYDQTVPLARVVAQYQNLPKPYKRYQIQPVWRGENTQKGRYREFLQCDADIIGDKFPAIADGEILALFWYIYEAIGFQSFQIIVNSRYVLKTIITKALRTDINVLPEKIFLSIVKSLDKLSKKGFEGVQNELLEKNVSKKNIDELFNYIKLMQDINYKQLEKIDNTLYYSLQMAIEKYKVPEKNIKFDPTLSRGLDYYTGLIFEGNVADEKNSLGGGGRYDNLIGKFTGNNVSAVGFAIGFDRTLELAKRKNLITIKKTLTKVMIAVKEDWEKVFPFVLELITDMRKFKIKSELYLNPREKLDKQIKYADRKDIPYVVIIGQDEIKKNSFSLRNMEKNTQQEVRSREELFKILVE